MSVAKNNTDSGENVLTRMVHALRSDQLFSQEHSIEFLRYIFLLAALAMLFIANSYYAEKTIREIDHVTNELKELRSQYITTKSDLMVISKQSEVAKMSAPLGIRESLVPPKKLIIRSRNTN